MWFQKLLTFLNGKKTYVVLLAAIGWEWVQVWDGKIDQQTAVAWTLAALGGIFGRSAVAKVQATTQAVHATLQQRVAAVPARGDPAAPVGSVGRRTP